MRVYIAIRGSYDSAHPSGVYASPELAMADNDSEGMRWTETTWAGSNDVPQRYRHLYRDRYKTWTNDRDWEDHVRIEEFTLIKAGDVRPPDVRQRQVYRESDGGWDYVPEDVS